MNTGRLTETEFEHAALSWRENNGRKIAHLIPVFLDGG